MTRLCVICEGSTEAEFVRVCLEPHLRQFNVVTYPSLLKTRPGKQGGGNVTVARVVRHLQHEYHNSDRITTLLDLYGFADAEGRSKEELENHILAEAGKLIQAFNHQAVLPYIQKYEFEGLLFSDIEQFCWVLDGWDEEARAKLAAIRQQFDTPEDINNSRETAPSKRIAGVFNGGEYGKVEHGPIIASEIGMARLMGECPLFCQWVRQLELMGDQK